MDPVSHAAFGASLGVLAAGRQRVRGVVAAAVTGAMLPDLDAVVMPFGWDRYLRIHEIGTHSILGTIACGLVAAACWPRARRESDWRRLAIAGSLGAAGHVLLDVVSSARIRVFWPFVDHQVTIPIVAMADPWLAGLLACALPALLLPGRLRRRVVAGVLSAALVFLGVKANRAREAARQYLAGSQPRAEAYMVEARWASLDEWHIFDKLGDRRRQWRSGPRGLELVASWDADTNTPAVIAASRFGTVRNFVPVHELAFPIVVERPDRTAVLWSDPRFCWRPAPDAPERREPALAPAGDLACAVWAGGELDDRGTPLREVVHVFGFTPPRLLE